jgi:hypothetical protein
MIKQLEVNGRELELIQAGLEALKRLDTVLKIEDPDEYKMLKEEITRLIGKLQDINDNKSGGLYIDGERV